MFKYGKEGDAAGEEEVVFFWGGDSSQRNHLGLN